MGVEACPAAVAGEVRAVVMAASRAEVAEVVEVTPAEVAAAAGER